LGAKHPTRKHQAIFSESVKNTCNLSRWLCSYTKNFSKFYCVGEGLFAALHLHNNIGIDTTSFSSGYSLSGKFLVNYHLLSRSLLLFILLIGMLAGCGPGLSSPPVGNNPAAPTTGPIPFVSATPTVSIPTSTAAVPTEVQPAETPQASVAQLETQAALPPIPSGWVQYSNPDFVRGLLVHENQLWVASLGGVVLWDLETQTHTLYTTRDGLVEIQANDIVHCSMPEGRIVIAHETSMLSTYDLEQKKWIRLPITFDDGSTMQTVETLFCDTRNKRLITGSADGIGILDINSGKWKRIGAAQGLKADTILAIDVVGQSIWVAAGEKSAYLIMGNTVFPFNASTGFPKGPVYDLSVSQDGAIWMGYPSGLVQYRDKRWNSYGAQTTSSIPFTSINQVEVGSDNTVWIASAEQGICPFSQMRFFCSTIYPGLSGYKITDLFVDAENIAYAGTNGGGVLILQAEQVLNLAVNNQQLISNDVMDIAESADGLLWVATDLGVNVFDPYNPSDPWRIIRSARSRLVHPRVSGLQATTDGMWFFYEKEKQASFLHGEEWLQLDEYKGLSSPVLHSAVDHRGYVWFASEQAIHIWDGVMIRSYGPSTGLPGSSFRALFEKNGEMWIGTDRGLLHYERFQWYNPLPGLQINAINSDKAEGLLLGTDQGLIRFVNGQSFQWIINLGNEVVISPKVTSIAWDLVGHLWVGTDGDGLFHFDGERWERFDTARGMPTNHIRKILTDRTGAVWILSATGKGGGALVRYMP
jgi:ligand-binding sensor domain-containing protein